MGILASGRAIEALINHLDDQGVHLDALAASEAINVVLPHLERDSAAIAATATQSGERIVRSCMLCGCTDDHACIGGCSWVGDRLCSACLPIIQPPIGETGFARMLRQGEPG